MMALQSCHALCSASALLLSSNRSATSRTNVPSALALVSPNREKKASMSWAAVMVPDL